MFSEDDDKPATSVVIGIAEAERETPGEVAKLTPGLGPEKPEVGAFATHDTGYKEYVCFMF